ncbi:MAG: dihydrofolate reductase family protein [Culicoidibacterales bacterium]
MMELVKIPYDAETIKLTRIFDNTEKMAYNIEGLQCPKVDAVYGKLMFGALKPDVPITFCSFVTSMDGKIAFADAPEGPLIAQKNLLDPGGASADFWVLNMLRANCDGIICGAGTIASEPQFTGHIFDVDLEAARVEQKGNKVPPNIIISLDGTDIPFDHLIFAALEIPLMVATSPNGCLTVTKQLSRPHYIIDATTFDKATIMTQIASNKGKTPVIITGKAGLTDADVLFKTLKLFGIDKLLVESPTYTHFLIKQGLMDEMFVNYSCIYLGGNALSLGGHDQPFPSDDHPHTELVSVHAHSGHFLYFRHKLIYGIK